MADRTDILIAEDNPADVRLIEEALRGIEPAPKIQVASDGEQVLARLAADGAPAPQLLFLDLHLPRADSRDVLRQLRSQPRFNSTAIVVLSTSDVDHLMREAYALGADCYISKPCDLEEFLRAIRSAARYWLHLPRTRSAT